MYSSPSRPARCLITGASGFIGTRLTERFDLAGVQPYVPLMRSAQAAASLKQRSPRPAIGDLLDTARVREALDGCDAVIHLAHDPRGPEATRRLVACAIERGIGRFVYVSTMSVHGPAPGQEAAREDTARIGRYNHDYSDAKAEQEEIVQAAHQRGDLPVVILRPTIVYGPHSHFVMQILAQAQTGVVHVFDQGAGICNAVYVDDVCDAIDAALTGDEALGEAMFINGDESIAWGDFINAFASMVEPTPALVSLSSAAALDYWRAHPATLDNRLAARVGRKIKRLAGWQAPVAPWPPLGHIQRECFPIMFTNDKAKRLLDWAPKVHFDEGVVRTRRWLDAAKEAA